MKSEFKKFDSSTLRDKYFTIFTSEYRDIYYLYYTNINSKFCEKLILQVWS